MATIDEIVDVSITIDSRFPARLGFGTPLVLGYTAAWADSYRVYSSLADAIDDGIPSYSGIGRKLAALFAQNPSPAEVVVGRLPSAPAFTNTLTMTSAVEGQHVQCKVISPTTGEVTQIDYTIPSSATTTTVATAVELLIDAVAGVDSSAAAAVVTVTPTTAGQKVHIYDLVNCTLAETTADANYDDALTALLADNNDWYFITIDSSSPANIAAVAAWTLANQNAYPKLFFWDTSDSSVLAGTVSAGTIGEAAEDIRDASNDRSIGIYHPNSHEAAAAAWVGVGAPQDPGAITWALKSLAGVTAKSLTATQRTNLENLNINHYQPVRSIPVTRPGIVGEGEWIDIVHGVDALKADLQESIFALLANNLRVPFTGAGLDLVENTIKGSLGRFEGNRDQPGLLVIGQSRVVMPALSSLNPADIAARHLKNVRFSAKLAGAIHRVSVRGVLSYV